MSYHKMMPANLLQKLREWRTVTAEKEGVPTFRVLSNMVLEDIVRLRPKNKEELLAIKGFKDKRYDRYGVTLLALINEDEELPHSTITNSPEKADRPLSVSEYLSFLNTRLGESRIRIQGEISSLDMRDKAVYFSMKDAEDASVISCLVWRNTYDLSGVEFELGTEIIVEGFPEIYKPTGRLSFKVSSAELVGEGALRKQYEKLKEKLQKEGLFAPERKRPLPSFPTRIGLITSRDGAVIGDFQTNLGRYGFHITMIDSRVEGQLAVAELVSAIRTLEKRDIDVLVIIRGGGSLESLLPFNNEALVREIVDFPVPVLAGVGHDKDVPLLCLVADKTVSTPTATAQALNDTWQHAAIKVELNHRKILISFKDALNSKKDFVRMSFERVREQVRTVLEDFRKTEQSLQRIYSLIKARISELRRVVDGYPIIIRRGMKGLISRTHAHTSMMMRSSFETLGHRIDDARHTTDAIEKLLSSNNPERQLRLGYSIVQGRSGIVRSVTQVTKGEEIVIRVQDGSIASAVTNLTKSE